MRSSASAPSVRPRRHTGSSVLEVLLTALALAAPCTGLAQSPGGDAGSQPEVGPASGTVIVAGGGDLEEEIWSRFVELSGGDDARIVVIPTAGAEDAYSQEWDGLDGLVDVGADDVIVLHTRDREVASTDRFVDPLRDATGVWIPGGRQWRLVDAYMGTRVLDELSAVLERGGVVGGTSAGASILASFLVRGDPATNRIVLSDEYREGFGFLRGTAIDQHLFARARQNDLWEILTEDPELLGIGLDEGTALVVHRDIAEVIGRGLVLMYDASGPTPFTLELTSGDRYHLGRRRPLGERSDALAPSGAPSGSAHADSEHAAPR